jgi:ribosomal protein S18 acetylase RimI-like enzyme
MTLPPGFTIRQMRPDDVAVLEGWATTEGWNPGLGDLAFAYSIDPDAFIALHEGPDLVGAGSVFRHNDSAGFMGLFIIHPDYRGRGLGAILWKWRRDRLIARLGPNATIGMDGVLAMVPFYKKGGFRQNHLNVRFQGMAHAAPPAGCTPISEVDPAQVMAMDLECFGSNRAGFISSWLKRPGVTAMGLVEEGRLTGFGVARPCRVGHKIGPLYARSPRQAERILNDLSGRISGDQVQIDAPDINHHAAAVFAGLGWSPVFQCARLYLGPAPAADLGATYGVASLEFG